MPTAGPPFRDRLQTWLVAHGWTSCFAAALLVLARVKNASFELDSMFGRTVSTATAHDYDIGARNTLFLSSVVLFALVFVVGLFVLRGLALATRSRTIALLEPLSLCGLSLLVGKAFLLPLNAPIVFVATLEAAWIALALIDRWIFRRGEHREPAAYFAVLSIAAFGLILVMWQLTPETRTWRRDWTQGWFALWLIALHSAVRLATWRRDAEHGERTLANVMAGLPALAFLPALPLFARELFHELDSRGSASIRLVHVQVAVFLALAAFVVWLSVRATRRSTAPSLEQALSRWGFPLLLFAMTARVLYVPFTLERAEMFESANAGLTIQQWFDFGRVPYVETFSSHGLFDSLFGLVWVWLHPEAWCAWFHLEFLREALSVLLTYELIRRASGNAYLALFVCALFPFRNELSWWYLEWGLLSPLALWWALAKPSLLRWIALTALHAFLFAWRLDIGFAATAAALATLLALRWLDAGLRVRWRTALAGWAACTFAIAATYVAIALARGVELVPRMRDLAHILDSNQGFGYVKLAHELDAPILWHLAIVPVAMVALLGAIALYAPRLVDGAGRLPFVAMFLLWGPVFYFANAPRGLVRHTWIERHSFLPSFSLLCLALVPYLWPRLGAKRAGTLFLAAATLLGATLAVQDPRQESAFFETIWERSREIARLSLRSKDRPGSNALPVRDPKVDADNYARFRDFTASVLTPAQTFVDLTNSGMLYVDTHRRALHFPNHLLLAHDEWLQLRQIESFQSADVPFVLVMTEADLAEEDEAKIVNGLDGLPNDVRQGLFREWLYPLYEPWCIVQRWQVWRRKDWCSPVSPPGDDRQLRSRGTALDGQPIALDATTLEHTRERVAVLELDGDCSRRTQVGVRLVPADGSPPIVRELALEPGSSVRYWTLPAANAGLRIERVEVRSDDGFRLRAATLSDLRSSDYSSVFERAARPIVDRLWKLPWVWANRDERRPVERPVLQSLRTSEVTLRTLGRLTLDRRDAPRFRGGFGVRAAGVTLELDPEARAPKPGEFVRVPGSEPRKIVRVSGARVFFEGEPIDPRQHADLQQVEWLAPASASSSIEFEPFEDPTRPCYLHLRIAREQDGARAVVVRWGKDAEDFGGVEFELVERGPQDYLVRVSSLYRWARGGADRVWLEWQDGRATLESAAFLEGD